MTWGIAILRTEILGLLLNIYVLKQTESSNEEKVLERRKNEIKNVFLPDGDFHNLDCGCDIAI